MRRLMGIGAAVLLACTLAASAEAATTLSIETATEEGKKVLLARLTSDGNAVEGAKIAFWARRTFGWLSLGEEETLDDGTAAVPFPVRLPGGHTGKLVIRAEVTAPPQNAGLRSETTLPGGVVLTPRSDPFPRAVWAPRAPIGLVTTIFGLLTIVWMTYAYVVTQLVKLRRRR